MGTHANNEYIVFLLYPLTIDSSALAILGGTVHAELKDCASGNVGTAAKERVGAIVEHVLLSAFAFAVNAFGIVCHGDSCLKSS